jgi:hypothetical protein
VNDEARSDQHTKEKYEQKTKIELGGVKPVQTESDNSYCGRGHQGNKWFEVTLFVEEFHGRWVFAHFELRSFVCGDWL